MVVHVASEVFPFSRSGGLADVMDALPRALASLGVPVAVVSPWYADITQDVREVWRGADGWRLGEARAEGGVRFLFLGGPDFDRPGLYGPDDVPRFARWGAQLLPALAAAGVRAELLHGHDWAAGIAVARARQVGLRSVFTVHNLQYQGRWSMDLASVTELPGSAFSPEGLEYYGGVNLMKGGLVFADAVTTVSPTYAHEVTTPEFGEGLHGVLRARALHGALHGIVNGLDQVRWDPRADADVVPFGDLRGKAPNSARLRAEFGLDDAPIAAVVSRLVEQKGIDVLVQALPQLTRDWNVLVLGSGDPLLEAALTGWGHHPRVRYMSGMQEALAHRLYAGADVFLMPSRFEPCGLSQMISMRYGTLPVVRDTGGLRDTVPGDVGFLFGAEAPEALVGSMAEARAALAKPKVWGARVARAMGMDFSWAGPARQYGLLYERVMGRSADVTPAR